MNWHNVFTLWACISGIGAYLVLSFTAVIHFYKWVFVSGIILSAICLALLTLVVGDAV